jgi:hypothetical protein
MIVPFQVIIFIQAPLRSPYPVRCFSCKPDYRTAITDYHYSSNRQP